MRIRCIGREIRFSVCVVAFLAAQVAVAWDVVPNQYVVQLKEPSASYSDEEIVSKLRGRRLEAIRNDLILVHRDRGEAPGSAVRALEESSIVHMAEPNYIYRASRLPNDPKLNELWGLTNSGALDSSGSRGLKGIDINAGKAWDIETGAEDVVVAVIDTGVDFSIPDLKNNEWTNVIEAKGQPGVDDDGNGYIDDIHGYDAVNNDGDPTDDHSHGSHCAGTIGGEGNDGQGVVGVNWRVSIMGVKFLDASGSGTLADAVKGIDYATKMGAQIMSNSWGGGGPSDALKEAIERSRDQGALFVAAAGNSSSNNDVAPEYPASYAVGNIVSVAAIDNRGELADFSSYGLKSVHVAAPGVNVLSTVPGGMDVYSGTSMATPHVSGVAALLLAHDPGLTYAQLKKRMIDNARPLLGLAGKVVSGGMVDAFHALTNTPPPPDTNDPSMWTARDSKSVSSPHPYPDKFSQTYTITVPGAKRISAHFSLFETERGYDRMQFLNAQGESLGYWSGKQTGRYSPIVDGDTVILKFTADVSINGQGFDVDHVAYEP